MITKELDLIAIANALGKADPRAENVAGLIGRIREKTEDQWILTCLDPRFPRATLFLERTSAGTVVCGSLTLQTQDPSRVKASTIIKIFGEYDVSPPFPDGPLDVISFDFDQDGNDFTVDIGAVLTKPPEEVDSLLDRLTFSVGFRRENP